MKRETKISLAAIGLIALLVMRRAYEEWSKDTKVEREAEERDAVGTDASVTAMMLVSAFNSCAKVGLPNVDQCAASTGPLIEDKTASTLAKAAVTQRDEWKASCRKHFTADYCDGLLRRALAISMRQ